MSAEILPQGQPQVGTTDLLAFAVEARLKNGAIGHGIVFARSEVAAQQVAQKHDECETVVRSRRLPSHDMFRTTFKEGKVYTPQVFQG